MSLNKLVLEKSVSKSQQKLFGMVRKCQKTGECSSPEVEKVADSIKPDDAEDFAKTKHKGLPEKKEDKPKKKKKTFKEWVAEKDATISEVGTSCGGGTSTGDIASFKQPVFGGPLKTRKKPDEIINMKK
jgi:hypothetical protein